MDRGRALCDAPIQIKPKPGQPGDGKPQALVKEGGWVA